MKYTSDEDLKSYEDLVEELPIPPESIDCGYNCGITEPYGFVPEDGCPIHDK